MKKYQILVSNYWRWQRSENVEVCPSHSNQAQKKYLSSTPDGGGWSLPRSGSLVPRKSFSTRGTGGWVISGPLWTGVGNRKSLYSTRFRMPKRPTHSESLCQPRYPASKEAQPCVGKHVGCTKNICDKNTFVWDFFYCLLVNSKPMVTISASWAAPLNFSGKSWRQAVILLMWDRSMAGCRVQPELYISVRNVKCCIAV